MGMRNVMLEKIENFRDLGGYACDYGETSFGVIYRSATIAYASDADKAKIRSLGIKTIIDLREEKTKEALPCPFKGEEGITVSRSMIATGRWLSSSKSMLFRLQSL